MSDGDLPALEDPNPLLTLLRRCAVRVDAAGQFLGTGFYVGRGEVLTCAHVVSGQAEITVTPLGSSPLAAEVVARVPSDPPEQGGFHPLPDVALLAVPESSETQPHVMLDPARPVAGGGDALYLVAFTFGEHAAGEVVRTAATVEYVGPLEEGGTELLKLDKGQVLRGFSGCPVLNLRTGAVCGMVDSTRDLESDLGGFGIPVATAAEALPGLLERNAAAGSKVWEKAVEEERVAAQRRAGKATALPLESPLVQLEWTPSSPPSDLLKPRYRTVDLVEREELQSELMRWREREDPLSIALITGGGGFGKTRLALEECEAAQQAGWTAGLLSLEAPMREYGIELSQLAVWPGRLFIAIDYAETKPALVEELIRTLVRRGGGPPVRLVLVCRQALSRKELEGLFATGGSTETIEAVLRRAEPVRLNDETLDRHRLFETAVPAIAALIGRPSSPVARPSLDGEHFSRPLFVLSAALLCAEDPETDIDSMGRREADAGADRPA